MKSKLALLIPAAVVGVGALLIGCGTQASNQADRSAAPAPPPPLATESPSQSPSGATGTAQGGASAAPAPGASSTAPIGPKSRNRKSEQLNDIACKDIGNGDLCGLTDPQGYRASYAKHAGTPIWLDYNLKCKNGRRYGDEGKFEAHAGNTYSYVFKVGAQGPCKVIMYVRPPSDTSQGPWSSGYVG